MSKYSQAAIKAVQLVNTGVVESPIHAWERATSELFGPGSWGQKKGCPKNSFLGLCEEGLVENIPRGTYISRKNSKNKDYAIKAVNIVREQPNLLDDLTELWKQVTEGNGISYNYQLDVVKELIEKKYIKI
ncbi:DUF6979 family protein [Litchfieldia salsa]|uniref:Uncharacterized protein n=1 Tax=Litchfieldia salsa TaxID=930152 RepID=A0A1H0PPG9_9BACI|nr:hypothetical protein [Litchfieldia salsa]SDP06476.1 hypothetical protein SAMN05216565_101393 [Litchfieldia salsa]